MDTDRETRELRALCEQFKQSMHQQTDALAFDHDAKVRLGHMIGRAVLATSEYAYPSPNYRTYPDPIPRSQWHDRIRGG